MPPRRTSRRTAPPPAAAQKPKRSALAKENEVSAEREAEIKEAFALFAVQHSEFEDEEEGVISRADVRRCFVALDAPIPTRSLTEVYDTIDPENAGYIPYEVFFTYAAIHLKQRDGEAGSNEEGGSDSDEGTAAAESDEAPAPRRGSTKAAPAKRKGKGKGRAVVDEEDERQHIEEAYRLFTRGTDGPINLAHLSRIAKDLKQEVDDQTLKDMILEANGGVAAGDPRSEWRRGVGFEEFEAVMRRAGVFG